VEHRKQECVETSTEIAILKKKQHQQQKEKFEKQKNFSRVLKFLQKKNIKKKNSSFRVNTARTGSQSCRGIIVEYTHNNN
jgi:hypothetical protein